MSMFDYGLVTNKSDSLLDVAGSVQTAHSSVSDIVTKEVSITLHYITVTQIQILIIT